MVPDSFDGTCVCCCSLASYQCRKQLPKHSGFNGLVHSLEVLFPTSIISIVRQESDNTPKVAGHKAVLIYNYYVFFTLI